MKPSDTIAQGRSDKAEAFAAVFAPLQPAPFASTSEARIAGKQRLAASFRILAALGFAEGVSGHITFRDPEHPETFWVNPFGVGFDQICVSDLLHVDSVGKVISGGGGVLNVSAFAIHAEVHRARPDVAAAVHTHSMHGKSWSALGRLLDPINQDACAFFEDHVFFDDTRVLVTKSGEGRDLATALGGNKAAILRNHGLLTVGQSVDEAVWWFIAMERCCQSQFLAESCGKPLFVDPDNARATNAVSGSHFVGWLHFQTLWRRILREQPDFLS